MADGGGGLSLAGLGMMTAGAVLAYSGVNDPVGGPIGVTRDILSGKLPTPGIQIVTARSAITPDAGASTGEGIGDRNVPQGARQKIINIARTYLGVPYRLGGASRSGIDCSGLVLVSYRDGAGVKLPHLATAQAARGKRISRDQAQPADLAAWGVPGNYPHIALIIDANTCIVAPTWGKSVQYQTWWSAKVPGYGMPDVIRILDF
jgi:cell wall-associated NlpC family hydrolase